MYTFVSVTTGKARELFYHMKDVPGFGARVEIDQEIFERVIESSINIGVDTTKVKTIGDLADENGRKLAARGDKRVKPKKQKRVRPFWDSGKKSSFFAGKTRAQLKRYIMEGR